MNRLRVLISAHEFSPEQGSECAVGWNIVTRMAAFHDVTVLCADGPSLFPNSYRDAVSRYFTLHGEIPGLRVVYVEQPPITIRYARMNRNLMSLTKGLGWQPLYYMGLEGWHRAAFQRAVDLGLDNFDVVHQLTPISFLKPGYLWTTAAPFFWGPIGGMHKVPSEFARWGGVKCCLFEKIRAVNIEWQTQSSHCFKSAVQKAKRIWTVTEDENRIVDAMSSGKSSPMIDTSPPEGIAGRVRRYDGTTPLRLCWSGSHEPLKALPLLLHALADLPEQRKIVLDVLGKGSETGRWQKLARRLSLKNITWHGRLPYREALQKMGKADVLIHSSFREAASMVVLEALGWGMPVICHDACGMAVAVNDTCGIKIPFVNPERSIRGFRDALDRLFQNPEQVERLSAGALRRAAELSWNAKVKEISDSYSQLGVG